MKFCWRHFSWIFVVLTGLSGVGGCTTPPLSYEEGVRATYAGNDQFEIRSIGNSSTPDEEVTQYFYRKAYEVCAEKKRGFKIISKTNGLERNPVNAGTYCSIRPCYPNVYYRSVPFEVGIIECTGSVDPEFERKFSAVNQETQTRQGSSKTRDNESSRTNAISMELLGRANLYSLNYDHLVSNQLAIGAGVSYWSANFWWTNTNTSTWVVPIYANYYFMTDINRFFLTGGVDIISSNPGVLSTATFLYSGAAAVLGGGYEYRGPNGFLFRVAPYLIVGRSIFPTLGVSIGGLF